MNTKETSWYIFLSKYCLVGWFSVDDRSSYNLNKIHNSWTWPLPDALLFYWPQGVHLLRVQCILTGIEWRSELVVPQRRTVSYPFWAKKIMMKKQKNNLTAEWLTGFFMTLKSLLRHTLAHQKGWYNRKWFLTQYCGTSSFAHKNRLWS